MPVNEYNQEIHDLEAGVSFAYDESWRSMFTDMLENTDWDNLKSIMNGRCDPNGHFPVGSKGLVIDCQWTTALQFGDGHHGGGYLFEVRYDDTYDEPAPLEVLVEWDDEWANEHGLTNRSDEAWCVNRAIDAIREALERIK